MNPLEILGDITKALADEALIDDSDIDDAQYIIARVLQANGLIPTGTVQRTMSMCSTSKARRKEIVDEYMRYSTEQRQSPINLSRKRKELGASYNQMCRWSREFYGDACLERNQPRSAMFCIIELLERNPSMRRVDLIAAGVKRTSIPGALHWGMQRGHFNRVKGSDGMYRWSLSGARTTDEGNGSTLRSPGRGRRRPAQRYDRSYPETPETD